MVSITNKDTIYVEITFINQHQLHIVYLDQNTVYYHLLLQNQRFAYAKHCPKYNMSAIYAYYFS